MTNKRKKLSFSIFIWMLAILTYSGGWNTPVSVQQAFGHEFIRITNGEWPPWLSKDLQHGGLASHIVTEAFKISNIQVEYGFFPWARSKALAANGSWDGTILWSKNKERQAEFYFSAPVLEGEMVFFHLKSFIFDWNYIEDLKHIPIGATIEYNYGNVFAEAEMKRKIKVKRLARDELNFKKLIQGKIKLFPIEVDVGYDMLRKNFPPQEVEKVTHHPHPLKVLPFYLMVSKKIETQKAFKWLERFNSGLKSLKQSGQYARMISESRNGYYLPKK